MIDFGLEDKFKEVSEWYDGYIFGNNEIFNPWSIINYISKKAVPQAYWVSTCKNEILIDVLKIATDEVYSKLYSLLQGDAIVARINQNVVYNSLTNEPANIYSLLLVAGYLKTVRKTLQSDGSYLCELMIVNREIASVFKMEIINHMIQIGAIMNNTANKIAESLYSKDYYQLKTVIGDYLVKSMSFYDAGAEGFYHGLTLGIVALMDGHYRIRSNRESGDGRFDLALFPRESKYHGIIMELKWKSNINDKELKKLAQDAYDQIDEKTI